MGISEQEQEGRAWLFWVQGAQRAKDPRGTPVTLHCTSSSSKERWSRPRGRQDLLMGARTQGLSKQSSVSVDLNSVPPAGEGRPLAPALRLPW